MVLRIAKDSSGSDNQVENNKLQGHTSTVRIVKTLSATTIISASRDTTIRIWDIEKGICNAILEGHTANVRCLDVHGKIAVSGSYDNDARIWDLEKMVCLHVLKGHQSKIFTVGMDGTKVVTGSLDKTVRVWNAMTGECQTILEDFTSLVTLVQLLPSSLLTADASGVIRLFANEGYKEIWKVEAHQYSVTSMQNYDSKIASGGSDGKVRVWDSNNGMLLRELTSSNAVWQVKWAGNGLLALMSKDSGNVKKVIMKIWTARL